MSRVPVSLRDLNEADQARFVEAVGFVFEDSPHFAIQAWQRRPFISVDSLHETMVRAVMGSSELLKLALIRAHPDLAGKAAIAGTLTAESSREQSTVGMDRLSPEEFAAFTQLNDAYRERFGFPFIICVREHTKDSILTAFRTRLANSRECEIETALREIGEIARLRLMDAVRP